jgi:hypothetical protein
MIRRRSGTWRAAATVERRKASASGAASHDATRASPARPTLALAGATTITKRRLSALRPPFDPVGTKPEVQNPGAEMRRGNEVGRRRQGYGGLDHLPAEASAKAGGLFDIVKVARGTRGPLCPVVLAKTGTHDHGPVIIGPGSPLRGRRPGRGLVEHFGETKPIAVSLETEPARSLTLPPPIHRFRALSPRAETRTADRPRRPEATARQRDAPSGAIGVCKPSS